MLHDDLNPDQLILDPKHPGINDPHYTARRAYFFNLARDYRLHEKGIPLIHYEPEEDAIWSLISRKLLVAHREKACQYYLDGKEKLGLDLDHMPQLYDLNQKLQKEHHIGLVPAEGLLHTRTFFHYLSQRQMPCTQFIRHQANPEYTPEPDAVHDVLGHVPHLINAEFNDVIELIGQAVMRADAAAIEAWGRVYWFTIEFGLLQENDDLKVLGAGILSSFGEMNYCFSEHVTRIPFDIQTVINTPYDPTRMQDKLFVIASMKDLKQQVAQLAAAL